MKNKYKLIKLYPGSPELGTIAEKIEGIKYTYPDGRKRLSFFDAEFRFEKLIVNQPEYWEKVIEKNYEIVSYIQTTSNRIYYKDEKGIFTSNNRWNLSEPVEGHSNIKIHSVKRLSDGEVFTIGDKIKDILTNCITNVSEITFKDIRCFLNGVNINCVEKLKQPIFTTEDGVDIYKGDYCSHVNIEDLTLRARTSYNTGDSYSPKTIKYFSTEEKAEEYILRNKPCLSLNDVAEIYKTAGMSMKEYNHKISKNHTQDQGVKIINKVKEKLNMK